MCDTRIGNKPPGTTGEYLSVDIDGRGARCVGAEVCNEESVTLWLNGSRVASLTITPQFLPEFARGYVICEGLVPSNDAITGIGVDFPDIRVEAAIPGEPADLETEIRSSGCIGIRTGWGSLTGPMAGDFRVDLGAIFSGIGEINTRAALWKRTGGTHCTIILDGNASVLCSMEDMGRHNSVDKAVGWSLSAGIDLSRSFLVCTGRLPAGMVAKVYRAGIPVMASNTAPFSTGIRLARQVNMTLIAFARPPRMMIYSAPERIRIPFPDAGEAVRRFRSGTGRQDPCGTGT